MKNMTKKRIWIITEGQAFTDISWHVGFCYTKGAALKACRAAGFKYNKKYELFEKDVESLYRRVAPVNLVEDL